MRSDPEYLVHKYQQNLFAAALSITHNAADAEDAVQDAFVKYIKDDTDFENEEHLRAWLFRVVMNKSKDILKSFWHKNSTSMEEWMADQQFEEPADGTLAEAVLHLKPAYSSVLHLYYYEDYSIREISRILKIPQNTVKSRLKRGREKLKEELEKEEEDEYDRAAVQRTV